MNKKQERQLVECLEMFMEDDELRSKIEERDGLILHDVLSDLEPHFKKLEKAFSEDGVEALQYTDLDVVISVTGETIIEARYAQDGSQRPLRIINAREQFPEFFEEEGDENASEAEDYEEEEGDYEPEDW